MSVPNRVIPLLITVGKNRNIFVGDNEYDEGKYVERVEPADPLKLAVGDEKRETDIEIAGKQLEWIHVDAPEGESDMILVYGHYERAAAPGSGDGWVAYRGEEPECRWCDEVLVCAVNPRCMGGRNRG